MDIISMILQVFAMLAQHLGQVYERRPQQETLANAVAQSLSTNVTLMAKAPTGVGKSFAYLIPSILEIQKSRGVDPETGRKTDKRVIVTTANKALQDQLFSKDLPTLHQAMGGFTYAYLKGRDNYVCLEKADRVELPGIREVLDRIEELLGTEGFTGEVDQLGLNISAELKRAIVSDEDSCEDCTDGCFYQEQRDLAKKADILVVNHSLWIKDVFIRSVNPVAELLGTYHHVIVDEAHQLEAFGTETLGEKISYRTIDGAMKAAERFANMMPSAYKQDIQEKCNAVRSIAVNFFHGLVPPKKDARTWRLKKVDVENTELAALHNAMGAVRKTLTPGLVDLVQANHRKEAKKLYDRAFRRVKTQMFRCRTIGESEWVGLNGNVRVVEIEGNVPAVYFKPISLAPFMEKAFFGEGKSAVFTSATLPFDYIGQRLGIPEDAVELAVESPFPIKELGMLYVPKDLPTPPKWDAPITAKKARIEAVAARMLELVTASNGRALLLFTSAEVMNGVHQLIADKIPHTVLKQTKGISNKALADAFRSDVNSVLFGMDSFMAGVDFQGETCSLVAIDKMPFPIFGDPLVEARRESIEHLGKDSYDLYMVPEMVIKLDQAMGRLIRKTTDKGVVAVLDPRLRAERYDKIFDELPPFRAMGNLDKVKRFLEEL